MIEKVPPRLVYEHHCDTVGEAQLAERQLIGDPGSILDVGCGIRPCCTRWLFPSPGKKYVGIDAFDPYVESCKAKWPQLEFRQVIVPPLPFDDASFDTVVLDDVIEHLEKPKGRELLAEALRVCRRGVIVHTPNGFCRQDSDPWEAGGDFWQTHRSGWVPSDFEAASHVWHVKGHSKGPWMGVYCPKENAKCETSS